MKPRRYNVVCIVLSLFLLLFLSFFVYKYTALSAPTVQDFAQCITRSGAKMFGSDRCPHCLDQKAMFSSAFEFIDYVNCDFHPQECAKAQIHSLPTWHIGTKMIPSGIKSFSELAKLTSCEDQLPLTDTSSEIGDTALRSAQ